MALPGSKDQTGRLRDTDKGQIEIYIKASGALTAKTPYRILLDAYGFRAVALADGAVYNKVVVPEKDIADTKFGWAVIQGPVEDMIIPAVNHTASHAFKVHDGVITTLGATWAYADTEVGVFTDTSAAAATVADVVLYGVKALGTT
jgi:hypothetical protein